MVLKVENDFPKMPKQAEAKRDGVMNPQFQSILIRKMLMLLKRYESTKVDLRCAIGESQLLNIFFPFDYKVVAGSGKVGPIM